MDRLISCEEAIKEMMKHFPSLSEVDARWILSEVEGVKCCADCPLKVEDDCK